jgi:hypothetical protein
MAVDIVIKRGTEQQIFENSLRVGELAFATNTCSIFTSNGIQKCVIGRAVVDNLSNINTYSGTQGRLFYSLDTQHFFVHDGADWVNVTASGSGGTVTLSGINGITTAYSGGVWFIDGSNIQQGIGNIVWGESSFSDGGTTVTHNLGTEDHFTVAIPSDTSSFNRIDTARIGNIYVEVGANQDVVHNTGGPASWGLGFRWFATLSGSANYVSEDDLTSLSGSIIQYVNDLVDTVSGNIVAQIPSVTNSGNLMGTGQFTISGYNIVHNLNTLDHYVSVTPADATAFNRLKTAAIGEVYVEKGLNQDIVYKTGGPYSDGMKFDWEVIKHGLKMIEE